MFTIIDNLIDTLIKTLDNLISGTFPKWKNIPNVIRGLIVAFGMSFSVLFMLTTFALFSIFFKQCGKIISVIRVYPQALCVIAVILFSAGLLANQIRRHGIVVTALATIALLVLLKHIATIYGADATYIDLALKYVLCLPKIIVEELLPWIKDGLSVF